MRNRNILSEITPIVIATFFLVAPVVLLLKFALAERDLAEDYIRAVHAAMQPGPKYVSRSLLSVGLDQPVTVVTWLRRDQISLYKDKTPDKKNTWVTVVPWLKAFCQDYVSSHGTDPEQLTLRLKQRLGLPPGFNYDSFVEFKVDPKDTSRFFRPCGDQSPSTTTCEPASPPKPWEVRDDLKALADPKALDGSSKKVEQYWLLSNYFWSFEPRDQYPWSSLGYSFDWAPREDGSEDFVRWGESEFVISPGVPIHDVSNTDTVAYCTPQ
jgi:hypothetical protein